MPDASPSTAFPPVHVLDAIMGSGKTYQAFRMMERWTTEDLGQSFENPESDPVRLLYVSPSLAEIEDRLPRDCPSINFKNPQPIEGRKLWHLQTLIENGENVATTHALFQMLNRDIYELLKAQTYILVIDEALDTVQLFDRLAKSDKEMLFTNEYVLKEPGTLKLKWNHALYPEYRGRFTDVKNLCDNGNLAYYGDKVLIWEFPSEFLSCFKEVWVLTYLFRGSPMSSYMEAEGTQWSHWTMKDRAIVPFDQGNELEIKRALRPMVTIYEGQMNTIGERTGRSQPLSSTWYDWAIRRKEQPELKVLRQNIETYFKKVAKTPSTVNLWTTFTKAKRHLKGNGYSKGFLSNNAKATNDYDHKVSAAFACNTYQQPIITKYFESRGIKVYQDLFALSEMLQWLWRTRIRKGEPINVFIPSERMRTLLRLWLYSNSTVELMKMMQDDIDSLKPAL